MTITQSQGNYASPFVVLWAVFCSRLEDGVFQRAFSVSLSRKKLRSGFGRSTTGLSCSPPSSAGLFYGSIGIDAGLVDFCQWMTGGYDYGCEI